MGERYISIAFEVIHGQGAIYQHCIAIDIKRHVATALDSTIGHAVSSIGKSKILPVDGVLVITDGESDDRKIRSSSAGREDVALLS